MTPADSTRRGLLAVRERLRRGVGGIAARWLWMGLAAVTAAAVAWGLFTPEVGRPPQEHGRATPTVSLTPAPEVGHLAPEVTLMDLANNTVSLSSLRGNIVVLNFWYTACEPCRFEIPILERVYHQERAQHVVVVGVNMVDAPQTIADYLARLGVDYPVLRDAGQRAVVAYRVTSTPTSFIIDRHGVVRAREVGAFTDTATVTALIAPWLGQT